ncbi:hypothetical protein CHUAL_013144 [Chamberlinius hualienensis]
MWTGDSAPWPSMQWPLQQSAYQNIPHEQVDWAALAQQWIQMRETMSDTSDPQPVPQAHCPPPRPPQPINNRPLLPRPGTAGPLPEVSHGPQLFPERNMPPGPIQNHGVGAPERENDNVGGSYEQSDNNWVSGVPGVWQSSSWNNGPPNWVPPPSHPPENRDPSFEFERNHGNQGYGVQSFNYNHGSDQFYFNQPGDQSSYGQFWTQTGPMNPSFARSNVKDRQNREDSPGIAEEESTASFALDAVKCKNLPAWIREGLEKMDRDKQKKIERERMLQEREERIRRHQEEAAMLSEKGSSFPPRKSKFESDSEDEDSSDSPQNSPRRSVSPYRKRSPSPLSAVKSEPEKLEDMMLKVRQTLTEILLEVTNEEIISIAKDMLSKERIEAPAHQLAKSSALASITGNLGLDYDSDSETTDAEPEKGNDSEVEVQRNIQRRKAEFAERERQIAAAFNNELSDHEETEEEGRKSMTRTTERPNQGDGVFLPSITSEAGRERYFEKKYDDIPKSFNKEDVLKKSSGLSSMERNKHFNDESNRFTRSDSESSESSRKQREKRKKSKSDSSRSRSPESKRRGRRETSDDEKSSSRRSGKNDRMKRKLSRSRSKERSYRRHSDSRGSRKSRSRSRDRRRNSYSRRRRSKSRSRSYERSRYHHKDSRKRSPSRTSSSRSHSRERRSSRRSHSRSPKNKEDNWAGKK